MSIVNNIKTIQDKVEHLVFTPRFGDDDLNYSVLGAVNERAMEIQGLLSNLLAQMGIPQEEELCLDTINNICASATIWNAVSTTAGNRSGGMP